MSHLRLVRAIHTDTVDKLRTCECESCGRTWLLGEQDDNETICLRCEREQWLALDEDYYDEGDD